MVKRPITVRGRQLGLELRRLRNATKQSAEDVAVRLGWSQSKVTRIENGVTSLTRPDLLKLLDLYELTDESDRARFLRLGRAARERGWWVDYREVLTAALPSYIAFEADASELRLWSWGTIPGLLQTPDYAHAILRTDLEVRSEETTARLVEARIARQERLRDGDLKLWVVLDETLLGREIGGSEVMQKQLDRLLQPGPHVTLQVLPSGMGWHPGLNGAFTIMSFADEGHPPIAWSEGAAGDLYVDRDTDVARYSLAFDHLRAAALSPLDSRQKIAAVRDSRSWGGV